MLANHIDICKFDNENDDGYKQVRTKIKQAMEATGITESYRVRDSSSEMPLTGPS